MWLLAGIPSSKASAATEYEVKAAFLLNFIRFVDWPNRAGGPAGTPFSVCMLGEDPFGGILDQVLAGESLNGRPLAVRKIRRWAEPCEVLFVPAAQMDLFRSLDKLPPGVLTVGEDPTFLRAGGIINFVLDGNRVRFDVNQKTAHAASLQISSRLLSVARSVLQ